jgi:CheY-specific phosphatase CheX
MFNNKPPGSPAPNIDDLRAKYQLAPQPVNVQKIAGLVEGRAKASMEEITEIISTDSGVTQRLISLAYPRQQARLGATVQMATSRLGVNRVIVVMVGDLLTKSMMETFETMVSMSLEADTTSAISLSDHGFLTGSVRFTGQTNGQVTIGFSPHLTLVLAATLLGGDMDTEYPAEVINDTIGELVNIVTGNLQSKLSDAGMQSEVGLPEVRYTANLPKEPAVPGGSVDEFHFRHGMHRVSAVLSIDPSAPAISRPAAPSRAPMTKGTSWRANGP